MADGKIAQVPLIWHHVVMRRMKRALMALAVFAAIEGVALVAMIAFR